MNTCKNCKNYHTCGKVNYTTPCNNYVNRLYDIELAERIFGVYDLYEIKDNDADISDVLHAMIFTPEIVIKSLLDIIEELQDA